MSEPDNSSPPKKYKWPWFAAAAALLAIVLAVLWVSLAAKKVASERDFAPLPSSAPTR